MVNLITNLKSITAFLKMSYYNCFFFLCLLKLNYDPVNDKTRKLLVTLSIYWQLFIIPLA